MSGGKGGSSTTSVEVPAWLEDAARRNIARADEVARIGYTPYYGPDVAALTPMELSAGRNINMAANAFGLGGADPMAGTPMATNYGGMNAYSSGPIFDQSLAELERRRPGQYVAMNAPFIDPITGAAPQGVFNTAYNPMPSYNNQTTNVVGAGSDNGSAIDNMMMTGGRNVGPMQGPISPSGAVVEGDMRSDLRRSLTDPFYDPPGNVVSRALGIVSPQARAGDSMGGRK